MGILLKSLYQSWETFREIWLYLLISVLLSAAMRRYVNMQQVNRWIQNYRSASILASTSVAVSTPLCSCGGGITVALSMMAASISWGPLVAFMIASPLTSPNEVFYSAGLFGWPFALTYFVAAVSAGITGGFLAYHLERKGLLSHQVRFKPKAESTCCSKERATEMTNNASGYSHKVAEYFGEVLLVGRRLLLIFTIASFLGYLLSNLIPATWISVLFGSGKGWSVPLAATLGIPFYLNTSSSLPIVRAFIDHGATPGAAMAFLLVGAGTSMSAILGMLTITKWRVIAVVTVTLWIVAIICGFAYNALVAVKVF